MWERETLERWRGGRTVRTDLFEQPAKYAELGVQEYWRLDPTGGDLLDPPLQGEWCRSGRWTPIEVAADGGDGLRARLRHSP